jgi:hypothetical protein
MSRNGRYPADIKNSCSARMPSSNRPLYTPRFTSRSMTASPNSGSATSGSIHQVGTLTTTGLLRALGVVRTSARAIAPA